MLGQALAAPAALCVFTGVEALVFHHVDWSGLWPGLPFAASLGFFTIFFAILEDEESES
jgi:hypothetical protein